MNKKTGNIRTAIFVMNLIYAISFKANTEHKGGHYPALVSGIRGITTTICMAIAIGKVLILNGQNSPRKICAWLMSGLSMDLKQSRPVKSAFQE
jgi:hypothetical protein